MKRKNIECYGWAITKNGKIILESPCTGQFEIFENADDIRGIINESYDKTYKIMKVKISEEVKNERMYSFEK